MARTMVIWFPFEMPNACNLGELNEPISAHLAGFPGTLSREGQFYILTIRNVPSEVEGADLLRKIEAGLLWASVTEAIGVRYHPEPQQVIYSDDPWKAADTLSKNLGGISIQGPVHALIDGARPAIYPSDHTIRTLMCGRPTFSIVSPPERFLEAIADGAARLSWERIAADPKLALLLELYSFAHFQDGAYARFLALWTLLEAATPVQDAEPDVQEHVTRLAEDARNIAQSHAAGSAAHARFEALGQRLAALVKQSHTSSIRDFVRDSLTRAGDPCTDELVRDAIKLYDLRGRLLHEGKLELGDALTRLDTIVKKVVAAEMIRVSTR